MTRQRNKVDLDLDSHCWNLKMAANQIRSLAHLIKWQQGDSLPNEEIFVGIGEIIDELGKQILKTATIIEERNLA